MRPHPVGHGDEVGSRGKSDASEGRTRSRYSQVITQSELAPSAGIRRSPRDCAHAINPLEKNVAQPVGTRSDLRRSRAGRRSGARTCAADRSRGPGVTEPGPGRRGPAGRGRQRDWRASSRSAGRARGSCFFQCPPRGGQLAVRLTRRDLLVRGLSLPGPWTCWAHTREEPAFPPERGLPANPRAPLDLPVSLGAASTPRRRDAWVRELPSTRGPRRGGSGVSGAGVAASASPRGRERGPRRVREAALEGALAGRVTRMERRRS